MDLIWKLKLHNGGEMYWEHGRVHVGLSTVGLVNMRDPSHGAHCVYNSNGLIEKCSLFKCGIDDVDGLIYWKQSFFSWDLMNSGGLFYI